MKHLKKAALAVGLLALAGVSNSLWGFYLTFAVHGASHHHRYKIDDVYSGTLIKDVKQKLYKVLLEHSHPSLEEFSDPLAWQLILAGKEFENDKTLGSYDINNSLNEGLTVVFKKPKLKGSQQQFLSVEDLEGGRYSFYIKDPASAQDIKAQLFEILKKKAPSIVEQFPNYSAWKLRVGRTLDKYEQVKESGENLKPGKQLTIIYRNEPKEKEIKEIEGELEEFF